MAITVPCDVPALIAAINTANASGGDTLNRAVASTTTALSS